LRERKADIEDLVVHFLNKLNKRYNKEIRKIGEGVIEMLEAHDWYGNVRELENTLMQAVVMAKSDVLEKENIIINDRLSLMVKRETEPFELRSLADIEKEHIKRVLDQLNWNKLEASRILEITRPTLNAKIEKYNLDN